MSQSLLFALRKEFYDHASAHFSGVLWIIFALLCTSPSVCAQGCSDAGFCSIDALRPKQPKEEVLRDQIRIGTFYGNADHAIAVYGMSIAYDDAWSSSWRSEIKLTSLAQSSEAIQTFGLSDVLINIHFRASERMGLSAGIKWPLSDASNELNGLPLPMDHQSSLGTHDLIFGFSYVTWGIQWAAALQQPITQNNNQFLSSFYPSENELSAFPSTNAFNRSGDVLLRCSYPIQMANWTLTPSILPIYHLRNDRYRDEYGKEHQIDGSKGLTLNGNLFIDYAWSSKQGLQLAMGFPFIARKARPDGLTRTALLTLEYRFQL